MPDVVILPVIKCYVAQVSGGNTLELKQDAVTSQFLAYLFNVKMQQTLLLKLEKLTVTSCLSV